MLKRQMGNLKRSTSFELFSALELAKVSDSFEEKDAVICCLFDDLNKLLMMIAEIQQKSLEVKDLLEATLITLEFLSIYVNDIYYDAKEPLYNTVTGIIEIFSSLFKISRGFSARLNSIATISAPSSLLSKTGNMLLSGVALPGYDLIDWHRINRFKSNPPQEFQDKLIEIRQYIDTVITAANEKQQYQEYLFKLRESSLKDMKDTMHKLNLKEPNSFRMSDIKLLLTIQESLENEKILEAGHCDEIKAPYLSAITDERSLEEFKELEMGLTKIAHILPGAQLNEAQRLLETTEEGSSFFKVSSSHFMAKEEDIFPPVPRDKISAGRVVTRKTTTRSAKGKEEALESDSSSVCMLRR